jgi:hypothetical protein
MSYKSFTRAEVTKAEYEKILATQKANGTKYREQVSGGRKSLYVGKILVASIVTASSLQLDNVTQKEFVQLLAMFQKNVNKSLLTNDKLFWLSVPYSGYSKAKNKQNWANMPISQAFYSFDISNAYWQFAYRLGYISRSLYEDYAYMDNFKTAKRYCVTFLARNKKMAYTDSKGLKYDIICDSKVYDRVYTNIRNSIYQSVADIREGLEDGWIEFNTDGISVLPEYADEVKQRFKKLGLEFKITLCRKISDYQYQSGSKTKNFQTKINKV